jgi:hypothetical protein
MYNFAITNEIMEHGWYLVNNNNYGKRDSDNGSKVDQLVGMVAQCAIMDLFGYELPPIMKESDCGIDMLYKGIKIDIKANSYNGLPKPSYIANVFEAQKNYATDVYIFSVVHKHNRTLTITGWMDKADFFNKAKLRKKGDLATKSNGETFALRSSDYGLQIAELNQVDNLRQLIEGLDDKSRTSALR